MMVYKQQFAYAVLHTCFYVLVREFTFSVILRKLTFKQKKKKIKEPSFKLSEYTERLEIHINKQIL